MSLDPFMSLLCSNNSNESSIETYAQKTEYSHSQLEESQHDDCSNSGLKVIREIKQMLVNLAGRQQYISYSNLYQGCHRPEQQLEFFQNHKKKILKRIKENTGLGNLHPKSREILDKINSLKEPKGIQIWNQLINFCQREQFSNLIKFIRSHSFYDSPNFYDIQELFQNSDNVEEYQKFFINLNELRQKVETVYNSQRQKDRLAEVRMTRSMIVSEYNQKNPNYILRKDRYYKQRISQFEISFKKEKTKSQVLQEQQQMENSMSRNEIYNIIHINKMANKLSTKSDFIEIPIIVKEGYLQEKKQFVDFAFRLKQGEYKFSKLATKEGKQKYGYKQLWSYKDRHLIYRFIVCMIKATEELENLGIYNARFLPDYFSKFGDNFVLQDFSHTFIVTNSSQIDKQLSINLKNIIQMLLKYDNQSFVSTAESIFMENLAIFLDLKKIFQNLTFQEQKQRIIQSCLQMLEKGMQKNHLIQILQVIKVLMDIKLDLEDFQIMTKLELTDIKNIATQNLKMTKNFTNQKLTYPKLIQKLLKIKQNYSDFLHSQNSSQKILMREITWHKLKPSSVYASLESLTRLLANNINNNTAYYGNLQLQSFKLVGKILICNESLIQLNCRLGDSNYLEKFSNSFNVNVNKYKGENEKKQIQINPQKVNKIFSIIDCIDRFNIYQYIDLVEKILTLNGSAEMFYFLSNFFKMGIVQVLKQFKNEGKILELLERNYQQYITISHPSNSHMHITKSLLRS